MERHKQAVSLIASSVKSFFDRGEKFRIYHGSTNSTRPSAHQRNRIVDTSALSHVLKIDEAAKTALVEPNVPMDRLVETTLRYGLVPPVVMEFPGITCGGGYAGTSGESTSFKHGYFNQTMNSVEMVLANGEIVVASETERPDLFHGAAGAVGSLGVTTMVELRLMEAKKFVEATYYPVASVREAVETLQRLEKVPTIDYLDGILYSKTQGAIIAGRLTDAPEAGIHVQTFCGAWDPWFYVHVQALISEGPKVSQKSIKEAIPLEDYLFRYDRGGFWVGQSAFDYFSIPFNRYTRWFVDEFCRTRMMYSALHASGESKNYVVQDLALPYENAEEFINYTEDKFGIWPLWLCPLKQSPRPTMHPNYEQYEEDGKTLKSMLNIGLWGRPSHLDLDLDGWVSLNRDLEFKLAELRGMKWLYAHTYYTEDEFWKVYDKYWYDALRKKYGATGLPSVYEKVKVDVVRERKADEGWGRALLKTRPFGGFWGLWKSIQSKEYMKARRGTWKSIEAKD